MVAKKTGRNVLAASARRVPSPPPDACALGRGAGPRVRPARATNDNQGTRSIVHTTQKED